jgi:hypothetical protein
MAENLYFMANGFSTQAALTVSGTPAPVAQPSGASVGHNALLLQLSVPATRQINIVEYGVSLSGSPASAQLLLISNNTATAVGATGVILPYSNPNAPASLLTTASCGYYTATSGTLLVAGVINSVFDQQLLTTNTYVKQFPLAREPVVPASSFCQIVLNVPTTSVTAYSYIVWRE